MTFKEKLHQLCVEQAEDRIRTAEQNIGSARDAQSGETKSSAGDKYETSREMMQQEISFNQTRLLEARKLKYALSLVNPLKRMESIQNGSLVYTNHGAFYIAAAVGVITVDSQTVQVISPGSPLARAFTGKAEGSTISVSGKEYAVVQVL